jgi:hypothetical protein
VLLRASRAGCGAYATLDFARLVRSALPPGPPTLSLTARPPARQAANLLRWDRVPRKREQEWSRGVREVGGPHD